MPSRNLLHSASYNHAIKLKCAIASSVKLFSHYIAEAQHQQFIKLLCKNNFFIFLMDGSTDEGNIIEQELLGHTIDDAQSVKP